MGFRRLISRVSAVGWVSIVLLGGCATPQERAARAFCEAEGANEIVQKLETIQVSRQIYIGARIVGSRKKCRTEQKTNTKRDGTVERIVETICTEEPIKQAVYAPRLVDEIVDINSASRASFVERCLRDALAKGMFSHLR
jgi:hypothetical protein